MQTMTSPPEVRIRTDKAADAPPETPRRRTVQPSRRTAPRTVRTGTTRPAAPPRPTLRRANAPKAPFAFVIVGLLGGGLVSLLVLNTVLAQDAFTLGELRHGNQRLEERKQALREDIARETSPEVLRAHAKGLGMRDQDRVAFIDPRTGRVIGDGTRPAGVPDEAMSAAAAGGVTGSPGALVPPAR